MKWYFWLLGSFVVAGTLGGVAAVIAQRPPGPAGPPPLIVALDADRDGTLSAEEIQNATAALLALDKNHDGALSEDELRPPRPPRPEEFGNGPPCPERDAPDGRNAVRPQRPEVSPSPTDPVGTLIFSGGHETDPRDHSRPVSLVAGALGVSDEVFRDAFSRVRPAHGGAKPDSEQVRQNKRVLLEALGKHGISNERLDTVSNYYRYVHHRGEMWPTTPARGYAKIEDGKVTGFVITAGGSGYSSPPTVSVQGLPNVKAQVKLAFSKDFNTNGSISEVTLSERVAD